MSFGLYIEQGGWHAGFGRCRKNFGWPLLASSLETAMLSQHDATMSIHREVVKRREQALGLTLLPGQTGFGEVGIRRGARAIAVPANESDGRNTAYRRHR